MSSVYPIAKLAVHVVASVGVSKVVGDFVKNNTNVATTADAVKVWTGSLVIGSLVAETASKHVNERMNSLANWYAGRKANETEAETVVE